MHFQSPQSHGGISPKQLRPYICLLKGRLLNVLSELQSKLTESSSSRSSYFGIVLHIPDEGSLYLPAGHPLLGSSTGELLT